MVKFVIYTYHLSEQIGGLVVLHNLARELKKLGYNVFLYSPHGGYGNKFCTKFIRAADIDKQCIVVYPEIIEGNPLKATNIVRWLLCDIGINGKADIQETWNSSDIVFHYSTFNKECAMQDIDLLYTIWINPLIRNRGYSRKGTCHLYRKALKFHQQLTSIHPKKSICIDNRKLAKQIDIFNRTRYFYCYDPYSFYTTIATLCGCIAIVYPMSGISKQEWLDTLACYQLNKGDGLPGIAYGLEELGYAEKTIQDAWTFRQQVVEYGTDTVKKFAEKVINYFFLGGTVNVNTIRDFKF